LGVASQFDSLADRAFVRYMMMHSAAQLFILPRAVFPKIRVLKIAPVHGARYRNLTTAESQRVGNVNGVALLVVMHGSPAASVGLLPDDIITKFNGKVVTDQKTIWAITGGEPKQDCKAHRFPVRKLL
jgi:hypothetical protein